MATETILHQSILQEKSLIEIHDNQYYQSWRPHIRCLRMYDFIKLARSLILHFLLYFRYLLWFLHSQVMYVLNVFQQMQFQAFPNSSDRSLFMLKNSHE